MIKEIVEAEEANKKKYEPILRISSCKEFRISIDDIIITVNAYSYTIITAHKQKAL